MTSRITLFETKATLGGQLCCTNAQYCNFGALYIVEDDKFISLDDEFPGHYGC